MINHGYSVEQLVHIICGRCRRPWTISVTGDATARTWTCTHCEYIAHLEPMPPMPNGETNGKSNETP